MPSELIVDALGVAITPIAVIAAVLMLLTDHPMSRGAALLIGWIVGISIVASVPLVIAVPEGLFAHGHESDIDGVVRLALGALLIVVAYEQLLDQSLPGKPDSESALFAKISGMQPKVALGFGAILSAVHPKNLVLALAAGLAIAELRAGVPLQAASVGVFVLFTTLPILLPLAAYVVLGERAVRPLTVTRTWLAANSTSITGVLLAIFGVFLCARGLVALLIGHPLTAM
jgi:hypothetical protein